MSSLVAVDAEELAGKPAVDVTQHASQAAGQEMPAEGHTALALTIPNIVNATQPASEILWTEELPAVGHSATTTRTFHAEDVMQFAHLSGDKNPLHLEPDAWIGTPFTGNLVHGVLTASLFSQLMGMHLPGPGSVYLSQMLKFQAPVYLGESVSAEVTVTQVREDQRIITLQTHAWVTRDGAPVTVLDGEAVVKVMIRPALGEPSS